MTPDERILRRLLWLRHGCPTGVLYGDDGEMQCGACIIDFLRMSAEALEEAFHRQTMRKLAQARPEAAALPPSYLSPLADEPPTPEPEAKP